MVDVVRALGHGDPPLGYSFDYEDTDITEAQLHDGFAALDAKGAYGDYYSGPHAIDHGQFMDREWWNAAYPGSNDGSFPGYGSLYASSRPRPMVMWQYSSGGGLDRDLVVDDAWYAARTQGQPTPATTLLEEDGMHIVWGNNAAGTEEFWLAAGSTLVHQFTGAPTAYGPQDAVDFAAANKGIQITHLPDGVIPEMAAQAQRLAETWARVHGIPDGPYATESITAELERVLTTPAPIDVDALATALAAKLPARTKIDPVQLATDVAAHLQLTSK
jgi:hypothetical protein